MHKLMSSHLGIFLGFLTMIVASLKMASRTTTSMTPLDPPPSNDKIDVTFRRGRAAEPLEGVVGVVGGAENNALS